MDNRSEESRTLFGDTFVDRPLFGDSNRRDRIINLGLGLLTGVLFVATLFSAFLAKTPIPGLNIYLVFCISLIVLSHILLIYWYRQGDLDPKFRILIYYNSVTLVLLSTCALSIFFSEN